MNLGGNDLIDDLIIKNIYMSGQQRRTIDVAWIFFLTLKEEDNLLYI